MVYLPIPIPIPIPTQIKLDCIVIPIHIGIDTDTNTCTNGNADGCCTQIGIYIGTDKVEFNLFSFFYIDVTIGISPSVSFLHIVGICIGIGISHGQCKPTTKKETHFKI